MKYILSKKQVDKFIKPFLDGKVSNCEFRKGKDGNWIGFYYKNTDDSYMFIHPIENEENVWAFDEYLYDTMERFFGIERYDFKSALKRYMKKYHNLKISKIV